MAQLFEKLRRALLAENGLPLVWIALTAVVLIPVWHQRLIPMLDAPNHMALARAWHSFHDPSYRIAEFYDERLRPVPYILYYLVCHLLMYVVSIEAANKIFFSLYLILFPLSVLALARALKRSPWLALAGFPLAFNQNWIYGFGSYLMSTCFMFFSLALLIRFLDEGRPRQAVLLGVATLLAYFGHVMPWFCLGLGAIALLILSFRQWRRVAIASAAMLPSVVLALAAFTDETRERTYMNKGHKLVASWRDFPDSVREFPKRVMELFPGRLDMLALCLIAAAVLVLYLTRRRRPDDHQELSHRRLRWLLLIFGLTYLSLPYQVTHPLYWWFISPRVPSMMAPMLLLLPTGEIVGWRRALLIPIVAAAVALPIKLASLYRSFSIRNAPFMHLVSELPRGATTLVVVRGMMRGAGSEEKSGDPSSSGPTYWHFSAWPMVLKGGYDPFLFDQGIPVRPKIKLKTPPWSSPDNFDIRQAPDYEYYIVRLALDRMDREPSLKRVDQVGEWSLYKRIHPLTDEP